MMRPQELEVAELIEQALRSKSRELDLEKYKLTTLPESLINLPDLCHLNLNIDLLDDLSILQNMYSLSTVTYASKIGFLKSRVYLPSRYWTKIGEWKSEWILDEEERKIKYFFIQKVGLEKIIEDLASSIHHLFELNLRRCYLTSLPDNIGKLIHLTSLDIGENQLLSLPSSIGNLINLKKLYVDENKLDEIPDSIENLVNLNKLMLCHNALMTIPSSILNRAHLAVVGGVKK
jgi:Leucine-rich repeat (LRR) protein